MTAEDAINHDFRDLIASLDAAGAEFAVGAYALAFHGVPRATGDLDVFVRPSPANAARDWRALAAFGAPLRAAGVTEADLAAPGTVYQIGLPPRRIDVLTMISGVSFDEVWSTAVRGEMAGQPCRFIARDLLIRNKRAAGRPKDLADVDAIERGGGR